MTSNLVRSLFSEMQSQTGNTYNPRETSRRFYNAYIIGAFGALLLCLCLFRSSDNMWRSWCADAPRYAHFSTVISPSWKTEQISVGKCAHWGASVRRERQTSFKIVTWTKQTWTKHHNMAHSAEADTSRISADLHITPPATLMKKRQGARA